jgi:hypothetical protein
MLICMLAPYSSLITEGLWKVNWNFLCQRLEPIHKTLVLELKHVGGDGRFLLPAPV